MSLLENDVIRNIVSRFGFEALFNTYAFLLLFLPVVLALYWLIKPGRPRLAFITAASLVFYSFWDWRFIFLLLASVVVDYVAARRMAAAGPAPGQEPLHPDGPAADDPTVLRARKLWLQVSLVFNLGMLAVWKYTGFLVDNARTLLNLMGADVAPPHLNILLPVGISFYTFQTLSYSIDVYRGRVEASRDPLKVAAFVTLFPQLVAGPIVRYSTVDKQLDSLPRRPDASLWNHGAILFVIGLSKKVLVADAIARHIDPMWLEVARGGALNTLQAWQAALGYTLQLYFDFSGYSDMALGLGALLGLRFPANFNAPYQAHDPSDFWRRWHISLGSFLRDYLFIPLGGSRSGTASTLRNLSIVMLLGGLWHGAAWTFVLWGAYHGVLLIVHALTRPAWDRLPAVAARAATFLLVTLGWVLFRAPDVPSAFRVLAAMLIPRASQIAWTPLWLWLAGGLAFVAVVRPTAHRVFTASRRTSFLTALLLIACLVAMGRGGSPFLYYQF